MSVDAVCLPEALAWMRRFPMDGALLLFDRESGMNALCDGPETPHLRQSAPRAVQFGITNECNLACSFCSRDREAESDWTADEAFQVLADLATLGVLEVAFGGGEPWAFPGFSDLVCRLYDNTPLAINFTTNGLALTPRRLEAIWPDCRFLVGDHAGVLLRAALGHSRFRSRREAVAIVETWRQHYNEVRPHSSLGYLTPNEFRAKQMTIQDQIGTATL